MLKFSFSVQWTFFLHLYQKYSNLWPRRYALESPVSGQNSVNRNDKWIRSARKLIRIRNCGHCWLLFVDSYCNTETVQPYIKYASDWNSECVDVIQITIQKQAAHEKFIKKSSFILGFNKNVNDKIINKVQSIIRTTQHLQMASHMTLPSCCYSQQLHSVTTT